ncbi:MAG TPA: tetratricopeptide repeat protein, partial [Nitrospiria bacterium]|nr:tetratricopeptide repeat protein [Nitrospiria bacterium]
KYERGACLEELGRYDEALEALRSVLPEYRNKPVVENRIRKTEEKKAKAARSLNSTGPKSPDSRPQE